MNLKLYHTSDSVSEILEDFIDAYYGQQMHYFASDLLQENFTPDEIMDAVKKAIVSCRANGEDVRKHFNLVYTTLGGAIVRDCRLTKYSSALVLLNGPANNPTVAKWQAQLINRFLKK